jgi:hypothetical protein
MYKDLITDEILEEINSKFKDLGTCLRIVEQGWVIENEVIKYKLRIQDNFIDSDYMIPNPNQECEKFIRDFFESKSIKLPFSNQVLDIWAFENTNEE